MSVMIELPDELAERLRMEAEKRGQALPEYVLPILEAAIPQSPDVVEETEEDSGRPKYLTRLLEIVHAYPPDGSRRMPADGAQEIDHYVYGLPKRATETP